MSEVLRRMRSMKSIPVQERRSDTPQNHHPIEIPGWKRKSSSPLGLEKEVGIISDPQSGTGLGPISLGN